MTLAAFEAVATPARAADLGRIAAARLIDGDILIYAYKASNGASGRNHLVPRPYKTLELQPPALAIHASFDGKHLDIRMTAERPALYVMAETNAAGHYSDNVIDLLAGETATIRFKPDDPADLPRAAQSLVVRDLCSSSVAGA